MKKIVTDYFERSLASSSVRTDVEIKYDCGAHRFNDIVDEMLTDISKLSDITELYRVDITVEVGDKATLTLEQRTVKTQTLLMEAIEEKLDVSYQVPNTQNDYSESTNR
jgi:hypothetical protein